MLGGVGPIERAEKDSSRMSEKPVVLLHGVLSYSLVKVSHTQKPLV